MSNEDFDDIEEQIAALEESFQSQLHNLEDSIEHIYVVLEKISDKIEKIKNDSGSTNKI